jgi:hypothetical protein
MLWHLALVEALDGRLADAARIYGFAGRVRGHRGDATQPNEARSIARLDALLESGLAPPVRRELLEEGAALSEAEVVALALRSES